MKHTIKFRICAVVAALSLSNNWAFAQFQQITGSTNQSWRFLPNNVSRIGIGNFPNNTNHTSVLTVNGNTTLNSTGEVFRTTGPSGNINAWRLFTGAGTGTEKFSVSALASSNNVNLTGLAAEDEIRYRQAQIQFVARNKIFADFCEQFGAVPDIIHIGDGTDINSSIRMTGNRRIFAHGATGNVGIGQGFFQAATPPAEQLNLNDTTATPVYMQVTNSTTTRTATHGFLTGIAANGTAELRQQEALPLDFFTANTLRMRMVGLLNPNLFVANAATTYPVREGNVGIGTTDPTVRLQIGGNVTANGGYRDWMDVGTLYQFGSDNMYTGYRNTTGDAIINWGNNPALDGPDRLLFNFTALTGGGFQASGANGLETARMISNGNVTGTRFGIGGDAAFANPYSLGVDPGNTLEINSPALNANTAGGSSGLRFTDLNSSSPVAPNPSGKVLSVNTTGDVVLVPTPAGTGDVIACTTAPITTNLLSKWSPASNKELCNSQVFDDGTNVGIGTTTPLETIHIGNTGTNGGIRMDAPAANINFTNINGGLIQNTTLTSLGGWIKIHGKNFQLDLSGKTGEDFRIGTEGSGTPGKGFYLKAFATGAGWRTGVRYLNTAAGTCAPDLELVPAGGNVFIGASSVCPSSNVLFINGTAFSTATGVLMSDAAIKTNVDSIPDALATINQLKPHTFDFKTADFPYMNLPSGKQYGLLGQEVASVLPDLVSTNPYPEVKDTLGNVIAPVTTYKGINYTGLIPILIQGIKEQQAQIASQQTQIVSQQAQLDALLSASNARTQPNTQALPSQSTTLASNKAILYQNTPNPFNANTSIGYYLAEEIQNAEMIFFDLYGNEIKRVALENKGNAKLDVNTQDLAAGIYSYSLIADGKVVETMKMSRMK